MSIKLILGKRIADAMQRAGAGQDANPAVARSKQAKFGDYQANGVLGAAKKLGCKPRELAERVVAELDLDDIAEKIEVAGPGFINIFLRTDFIDRELSLAGNALQPAEADSRQQTVVIDYSAPNLAKEMHVGHLRSTIIGDVLARLLEFQGYTVIRQNHMGDWGTQFGMLIAELETVPGAENMALNDLEAFYQQAKRHFDDDPAFADKARDYVVRLQSGEQHCLTLWQRFIDISISHSNHIYQQLGVTLTNEHVMPESAYNDALPGIVNRLVDAGLAVDDAGAKVIFLEELADKNGKPAAFIIQKSGGGYLYATTDIAALDHRVNTLGASRLMYFIDARQSLHMKELFLVGRKSGIVGDDVSLEHHAFGTMMGKDGKPFKTRAGGTVKLADFIAESLDRATRLLQERNSDIDSKEQQDIARKIGIGAIKYADLSKTRTNDYVFDWDSMLSFEGNTAPYLQYAYTRIRSIFRKAGLQRGERTAFAIREAEERELALLLLQFNNVLDQVAQEAYPHVLCTFLYELASAFMSFYEACPILRSDVDEADKNSRLALCDLSADTLRCGLNILGIETMEQM